MRPASLNSGEFSYDAGEFSYDAGEFSYDAGEFSYDAGEFSYRTINQTSSWRTSCESVLMEPFLA